MVKPDGKGFGRFPGQLGIISDNRTGICAAGQKTAGFFHKETMGEIPEPLSGPHFECVFASHFHPRYYLVYTGYHSG